MTRATLLLVTGLPGSGKSTIAGAASKDLAAAIIDHDSVMAGLRAFPVVWDAMRELDHLAFRSVGWTVMWNLALAELRNGRSVILDGVARKEEVARTRELGREGGCRSLVALCSISDAEIHRDRIVGRVRGIPNWPELSWEDVERSRSFWEPPNDVDINLDTSKPIKENIVDLRRALQDF
jgi:hypothetical protein